LEYPQPVLLEATIANKYLIARAGIQAQVESPGGEVNSISFKDDGIPPDEIADDGRYTGSMPYNANGSHTVTVNFDNASGEAVYTTKGLADGSQEFGDLVGTSLDASASTTITINGFSSDDHSDQFASATDLPSDNLAKWGQVDRPGDLDVFKGTLLGDGLHVLRLSNFAEGMKPRVKFWDAATGILIGDFTFTPVQGYYYIFYIKGPAGAGFYTEVSHSDGTASTGMYATSFGIPLEGEIFGSDVYLPIAIQR
jgi:hypothetical protein